MTEIATAVGGLGTRSGPTDARDAGAGTARSTAQADNGAPRNVAQGAADAALRDAAQAFEAAFLTEMLKHAGLGDTPEAFGGGVGEEQFAGFLREAQAQELAASGGIGLAEYIFDALKDRTDGA